MIMWSPFILHGLAGLRDGVPVTMFDDPTTDELARITGFETSLAGPSNPDGDGWADLDIGEDRSGVMSDFYDPEVIQSIFDGLETGTRWGFEKGYGDVTAMLYDTRIVAELLREYIDGEHTVDEALEILQSEVERLVQ